MIRAILFRVLLLETFQCSIALVLTPSKVLPLKLYGDWVDASSYAEKHRGGRWLLECAKGKDISLLFSAIHVMDQSKAHAAAKSLPRLEKGINFEEDAYVFSLPNYTPTTTTKGQEELVIYVNSALRDDLHEMMRRHFEHMSSKATALQWTRVICFSFLTISCWYSWATNGDIIATILLPFAHWLLASHTCHDATHGSLSESSSVNYWFQFTAHPIFFNVFVWMPQHLVSHHQHTNDVQLDVDMHHFAPARLSTQSPNYYSQDESLTYNPAWNFVLKGFLSTLGTCILQPARTLFSANTPHFDTNITPVPLGLSKSALFISMIPSASVLLWPLIHHHSLPIAHLVFLEFWPWIGASMIWTAMTQVSHVQHSTQSFDKLNNNECWSSQQISSSLDYSVTNAKERRIVSALTGGLNAQALHHALPTIAQSHLPDIYDEFTQICEKHGVMRATSPNLITATAECLDFVFDNNGM